MKKESKETLDQAQQSNILQSTWPVLLKTVKAIKKQGKSETLSQQSGAYGDKKTKCNKVFWVGFWNSKKTLDKNFKNLKEKKISHYIPQLSFCSVRKFLFMCQRKWPIAYTKSHLRFKNQSGKKKRKFPPLMPIYQFSGRFWLGLFKSSVHPCDAVMGRVPITGLTVPLRPV